MRVGLGYDIHRLAPGRRCVIGGVTIEHSRGPQAHSDGDVLLHALMDALLGAAALGDIGGHFPPDDPAYEGASSRDLLSRVHGEIVAAGYRVSTVDATVVAEEPRLSPHIGAMREAIAETLGIERDRVSVKATTRDRLGEIGRGDAIAALAVALLEEDTPGR
jgi:2-C-methyl-D-erythritol 2,4-cyclodiphosphate synthase